MLANTKNSMMILKNKKNCLIDFWIPYDFFHHVGQTGNHWSGYFLVLKMKKLIMVHVINNFVQCQWCNWYFSAEPDLEFEGFLKRQHTRLKYFQGSLMSSNDLERSKVKRSAKGWCYWKYHKNAEFVDSYQKKSYNFTSLQWVFESSHHKGYFRHDHHFLINVVTDKVLFNTVTHDKILVYDFRVLWITA